MGIWFLLSHWEFSFYIQISHCNYASIMIPSVLKYAEVRQLIAFLLETWTMWFWLFLLYIIQQPACIQCLKGACHTRVFCTFIWLKYEPQFNNKNVNKSHLNLSYCISWKARCIISDLPIILLCRSDTVLRDIRQTFPSFRASHHSKETREASSSLLSPSLICGIGGKLRKLIVKKCLIFSTVKMFTVIFSHKLSYSRGGISLDLSVIQQFWWDLMTLELRKDKAFAL